MSEDGSALADARIELEVLHDPWQAAQRQLAGDEGAEIIAIDRSGRDGSFRILAPEERPGRLVIRHPDHLPAAFSLGPLVESRQLPEVTLLLRGTLALQVMEADGKPAAGLLLLAHPHAAPGKPDPWHPLRRRGWQPATRQTTTSEDGGAHLPALRDEVLTVLAVRGEHFLYRHLSAAARPASLRLGGEFSELRVLTATGRPAAGIACFVRRPFFLVGVSGSEGGGRLPIQERPALPLQCADQAGLYSTPVVETRSAGGQRPGTLRLPQVQEVSGRVLDSSSSKAVAGAWVWAGGFFRQTGRDGAFRLRLAQDRFAVASSSYRRQLVRLPAAKGRETAPLDVLLEASLTLSGRVVDSGGRGLEGAEVRLAPSPENRVGSGPESQGRMLLPSWDPGAAGDSGRSLGRKGSQSAATDPAGRFQFRGAAPGIVHELQVSLEGYAPRTVLVPVMSPDGPAEDLEILLDHGLTAFGLVNSANGEPIAGAEVVLSAMSDLDPRRQEGRAITGQDGSFELTELRQGIFSLLVTAEGHEARTLAAAEISDPESPVDLGEVILQSTVSLRGRVSDGDGRALAGAHLRVRQPGTSSVPRQNLVAESDDDGTFEIPGLPRDTPLRLQAALEGYQEASLRDVRAGSGEPLRIILEPGISVVGVVVDPTGSAVPATVDLNRQTAKGAAGFTIETTEDGRFEFPPQGPGTLTLEAWSQAGRSETLEVHLTERQRFQEITLALVAGGVLRGRVFAPEGALVPDAELALERVPGATLAAADLALPITETSDGSGQFQVSGLDAGSYRFAVTHTAFEPIEGLIEFSGSAQEDVELVFRRRRERHPVSGKVIDAWNAPLSGVTLRLLDSAGTEPQDQAATLLDGRFLLLAPKEGSYTILAEHPGFAPLRTEAFAVGGEGAEGILLALQPGAAVQGQVRGLGLDDLKRLVIVAQAQAYGASPGSVGADGRYRVPNLAPGEWQIVAKLAEPFRVASGTVTLEPGEDAVLDLQFDPGFQVSGQVLAHGAPLADARLTLSCSTASFRGRAAANAEGRFLLEGAPAGDCILSILDPRNGTTHQQKLAVRGDTHVVVESLPDTPS